MLGILMIVIVLLGVITITQILDISRLSDQLKGEHEHEVTAADHKIQSRLMLLFLLYFGVFIAYQLVKWNGLALPESASVHGDTMDKLMNITWGIIIPVFIVCQALLFGFAFKYAYNKNRRADYFPHSNKLEFAWTIVPAITLTILIIYGMTLWDKFTTPYTPEDNPVYIELYAKQFDWTARYAGEDGKFGDHDFRLVDGTNIMGIDMKDINSKDDKWSKGEFYLPVNRPIQFRFRSQDIIHSAYMPHFRAQMNCVPGMVTQFQFEAKYTTEQMKEVAGNPNFEYVLLCNKICGAAHYNMQMAIKVVSEEEYNAWLKEQKMVVAAPVEEVKVETQVAELN